MRYPGQILTFAGDLVGLRTFIRKRRHACALAAIVILGLSLRLYEIGAEGFWFDETFSVWIARRPLGSLFAAVRQDSHPPLYVLLLHFWLYLGRSDVFIRLLSTLFSVVTLPVVYVLGRRIASRELGLLAALILAVSPFNVLFAQEARMYTLLTLAVSLSMYFLARLLTDPRAADAAIGRGLVAGWRQARTGRSQFEAASELSVGLGLSKPRIDVCKSWLADAGVATDLSWLGFMAFTTAALLTHNTAVFLPLGANIYVLGRYLVGWVQGIWRRGRHTTPQSAGRVPASLSTRFLYNWIIAQFGILLALSPWLPVFVEQTIRVDQNWWIAAPTLRSVYDTWWELSSACAPHSRAYDMVIPAVFGTLVALGILYFRRQPRWWCWLVTLALSPFVGELLVSLRRPIFLARTLLWFTIPYSLLLAAGLLQLRRRLLIVCVLSVLLMTNGLSLRHYYVNYHKEQWREAAAFVCDRANDQDIVLLNAPYVDIAFDYYYQRCGTTLDHRGFSASQENLAALTELIAGRTRVWLIYSHSGMDDSQQLLAQALAKQLRLERDEYFHGIRVLEYTRQ